MTMNKTNLTRILVSLVAVAVVGLAGAPAANAASGAAAGTCAGGDVSGTFRNLTIAGYCTVPQGATLEVTGNLTVDPGAALDAQTYSSTVMVGRNVTAGAGSLLGLGCQSPESVGNTGHPCVDGGNSVVSIGGNVTATGPLGVFLNGVKVSGNVTVIGGGADFPWSIKNNTIGGNITMSGQTTNWIGVLFNKIGRNATFTNIVITDTDPGSNGMYIGHNVIGHNLNCSGITPKVSPGFGPVPNTVGGHATGQCAALV
jgi:hypothetical protein